MSIDTYSSFTYGHTVTSENQLINFSEGGSELTATINGGSYSLDEYIPAVSSALNNAGGQEYLVTLDRITRKMTISASGNFELLTVTGSNVAISAYPMMGFTLDKSGTNIYEADEASGEQYIPQNILQKFVPFENNVKTLSASVRQTPSGEVEVVSYGRVNFMECMIKPITDQIPQISIISNANAVAEYRSFMSYCISKAPIEFVPDMLNPTVFEKCILESTSKSKQGVDFKIIPNKKLFRWFESGALMFRGL